MCILLNTCFSCRIGRDCVLGGKVASGLQQSLHLKPARNSCLLHVVIIASLAVGYVYSYPFASYDHPYALKIK